MSKFLRREVARACPVHTAVLATAVDDLSKFGAFSKTDILQRLLLTAMEDSIRWDYIRGFIEAEHGETLMALAAAYFKRHKAHEEKINPAKFMALGHGKKTEGFAVVSETNGHFALRLLENKRTLKNGVARAFDDYVAAVTAKTGLADLENTASELTYEEPTK